MKKMIIFALAAASFSQWTFAVTTHCIQGKIQRDPSVLIDNRSGKIIGLILGEKNTSSLSDGSVGNFKFDFRMSEDGPIVSGLERVVSCN